MGNATISVLTGRDVRSNLKQRQAPTVKPLLAVLIALMLSGCGSIISRAVPGQGHGNQYYPGVQWALRDTPWRYVTVLDLPLSLVFDTLLLPIDAHHGPYE